MAPFFGEAAFDADEVVLRSLASRSVVLTRARCGFRRGLGQGCRRRR